MKILHAFMLSAVLIGGTHLTMVANITSSPDAPTTSVVFEGATDGTGINVRWRASGEDQDNGSTFKMGLESVTLGAITLRIHPNNFGANVPGSPLVLHFFSWDGTDFAASYTPLWQVTANLPLTAAPNEYIRWDLSDQDQTLTAEGAYGFIIGAAVEDPDSGPNIFRIFDAASDMVPDAFQIRRDYEFGSASRPDFTVAPDIRDDRDLLFYVQAVPEPFWFTQWGLLPDGNLSLTATGQEGTRYALEATSSLPASTWQTIVTNTVVDGTVDYTDLSATSEARRFYRLREVPRVFSKLQILLPGETAAPGTPTGKTGTPDVQTRFVPFSITVNAVADDWSLVPRIRDAITFTSTDADVLIPPDNTPLQEFTVNLVNGTVTVPMDMGTAGTHTITVSNATNAAIPPDTSSEFSINP
jgi:hypothetical protein